MDENAVKRALGPNGPRGPSAKTVKEIEKGVQRFQTQKLDDYARAIDYPLATIFRAACEGINPDALLLAEQFAQIDAELRRSLLGVVKGKLEIMSRYPPAS